MSSFRQTVSEMKIKLRFEIHVKSVLLWADAYQN